MPDTPPPPPDATIAPTTLSLALSRIRERIASACSRAGRDHTTVTLVAVSKTHPAPRVAEAIAAGQTVFGENRVQEARGKFLPLRATWPGLRLHLIGPLQTNKAGDAVALFDVIESLDRPRLAETLAREMARQARWPELFLQVNVGEEPQKAGVRKADAEALLRLAREELGLPVVGAMCIPPLGQDPAPHFAWLAAFARDHGLAALSMGMSGDFEVAIAHGATHVRIGTAIFGERG